MTPSISAARIALCEASPMTQRSASTRFDLPQPLGPTMPVRPFSMGTSVGSTNDLKPMMRRRLSFIPLLRCGVSTTGAGAEAPRSAPRRHGHSPHFAGRMNQPVIPSNWGCRHFPRRRAPRGRRAPPAGPPGLRRQAKKPLSALEIGLEFLLEALDRQGARHLLAVDENRRRRVDAELGGGPLARLFDVVEQLLIRQALLKSLLGEARLLGDLLERRQRLLDRPALLLAEQGLDHGEVFSVAGAARQHRAGGRERVEREL